MATGRDLAEQLLRKAGDDESAARAMLPVESVTDAIVGFHAQQAVEKSLKAVLAAREVGFPFIHDISGLAELCAQTGSGLPDELSDVDALTPYAAGFRYDDYQPGVVERETALKWAAMAIEWATRQIEAKSSLIEETSD